MKLKPFSWLIMIGLIVTVLFGDLLWAPVSTSRSMSCQNIVAPANIKGVTLSQLEPDQRYHISLAIGIGVNRGRTRDEIKTAIMTMHQESKSFNLSKGDRDSKGLMQQRPSQGWGTEREVQIPEYALNKFYAAMERIPAAKRSTMTNKQLALAIQRPDPDAYDSNQNNFMWWEGLAEEALTQAKIVAPADAGPAKYSLLGEGCPQPARSDARVVPGNWFAPLEGMRVGSVFGMRYHPILNYYRMHNGADFGKPSGTPLYAMAQGKVLSAKMGHNNGAGNNIVFDIGDGYVVTYMHMQNFAPGITAGATVTPGMVVGFVGNTGLSTTPHLHLGIRKNGSYIDPVPALCDHGVTVTGTQTCRK